MTLGNSWNKIPVQLIICHVESIISGDHFGFITRDSEHCTFAEEKTTVKLVFFFILCVIAYNYYMFTSLVLYVSSPACQWDMC